jgi:hypothetical protein
VDSLQIRSFSDILFGSPATGYPTLSVIRDYVSRAGTHLLYIPTYIGGALMPDQYWPRTPEDLDRIIENYYRLPENPSSFWFGELYYSLGSMAVPLAFGVGIVTFWLSQSANKSNSLLARSFGVIAFMQAITLYKNGFSVFAINSIAMSTFVLFAWFMPTLWASRTSPAVPIFRLRAERERARSTTAADLR